MATQARPITVCASPDGAAAFRLWRLSTAVSGSGANAATADERASPAVPAAPAPAVPFSVNAVFAALAEARLAGDVALLERPTQSCAGGLADLLYELDPHGVLAWLPDGQGWDPVVEPGAQLDRLWHAGLRWSLAAWPEAAGSSVDAVLGGAGGAGEPGAPSLRLVVQTRSDSSGTISAPVAPVEAGERVTLHVEARSDDARIDLVEVIGDLDVAPGSVLWRSGAPDAAVSQALSVHPTRHGYVRARCRDSAGRWRYTAPLFLEVRPPAGELPFHVAWRWGDPGSAVPADDEPPAHSRALPSAAPVTLGRRAATPDGEAGEMAVVEAELTVERAGWHVAWFGVHAQEGAWADGAPAALEVAIAPEATPDRSDERTSRDGGEADTEWRLVGRYEAWHATDLPRETRAPRRWVPFHVALGRLEAGRYRLRFGSAAPGGGIALGYALVVRTPFPRLGVMAAHAHSTAAGAFSYYPARSLGYDLIITAEGSEGHLPTLWRQCLERSDAVPGGLLVRPGYEHADCFADHHLGPLFLPQRRLDGNVDGTETAPTYHNPHVPGWSIHRGAVPSLFHPHYIYTQPDGVPGTVYLSPRPRSADDANWRSPWTDQAHHGSGCWTYDHEGGHEGHSPYYWRTVPLFELWNAMSGENQDGLPYITWCERQGMGWIEQWKAITRPSQFRGPDSTYWPIVRKWHEALDAYCAGQRPAPLFAMADLDSQTRADPARVQEILGHRRATLVYLTDPEASYESYRAAVSRGNTAALCQHDTVLLVCATDAAGWLYAPGNHVGGEARWPLTVHVLAWAPRPITDLRLTGPGGTLCAAAPNACLVEQSWVLSDPSHFRRSTMAADAAGATATGPAPSWFRVECYGNERYWGVAATTNPFLTFPRPAALADAALATGTTSIYRYRRDG